MAHFLVDSPTLSSHPKSPSQNPSKIAVFTDLTAAPPDAIIGLTDAYKSSTHPKKVNVGVGAYRTSAGSPYVLPSVKSAEARVVGRDMPKEYAGIGGDAAFTDLATSFAYGAKSDNSVLASVQSLSGTGGLRVGGEFYKSFVGDTIVLPDPTWGNHIPIFKNAGLNVETYRYYDRSAAALDFDGMISDLRSGPTGKCVLLHACAHNPTGCDPTPDQWSAISDVMKERGHYAFFDAAYQGFASGDAEADAMAVRMFRERGHEMALVQSFSKNFGLYGERVGCLSVVCKDEEEKGRVLSRMKTVVRPMYSNPPVHGARIVSEVLGDEGLTEQWRGECKGMAERITDMRALLVKSLEEKVRSLPGINPPTPLMPLFLTATPKRASITGLNQGLVAHPDPDRDVLLLWPDPRAGGQDEG